jgi:hypothetical protein
MLNCSHHIYVLEIHNYPAPPQAACSGGRPIAPTTVWERVTGRLEKADPTVAPIFWLAPKFFLGPHFVKAYIFAAAYILTTPTF